MHSDDGQWNPAEFGSVLEAIKDATGMSQRDLAGLAGVHHSQVSRWKKGTHQPGYDKVVRLAAASRDKYPELGDLTPALLKAAGYGAGFTEQAGSNVSSFGTAGDVVTEEKDGGEEAGSAS
jgi:transcriptional regulator with XRE-family HTH domain